MQHGNLLFIYFHLLLQLGRLDVLCPLGWYRGHRLTTRCVWCFDPVDSWTWVREVSRGRWDQMPAEVRPLGGRIPVPYPSNRSFCPKLSPHSGAGLFTPLSQFWIAQTFSFHYFDNGGGGLENRPYLQYSGQHSALTCTDVDNVQENTGTFRHHSSWCVEEKVHFSRRVPLAAAVTSA